MEDLPGRNAQDIGKIIFLVTGIAPGIAECPYDIETHVIHGVTFTFSEAPVSRVPIEITMFVSDDE